MNTQKSRRTALAFVTCVVTCVSLLGCGGAGVDATHEESVMTYPPAPYGLERDDVLPLASFEGFHQGDDRTSTIATRDYFDPTGEKGIRALVVELDVAWCWASLELARRGPTVFGPRLGRGLRALSILGEGANFSAVSEIAVDRWRRNGNTNDVVADAEFASFGGLPGKGLPLLLLVDPRTMTIVKTFDGSDLDAVARSVDALLEENGAPPQ
jgi:hypothetical protein